MPIAQYFNSKQNSISFELYLKLKCFHLQILSKWYDLSNVKVSYAKGDSAKVNFLVEVKTKFIYPPRVGVNNLAWAEQG